MEYNSISFTLSDTFLKKYKNKEPNWGPLGFFTYRRTYSRQKENGRFERFWETCQRVVEGTFLIQKMHCKNLHLPWNERQAQKSSQEMFKRMFEFKFLPPGRGLWSMGSDFLFKRNTSAPLFNCGYISSKDIDTDFSYPFVWLMDMSMYGVGVGFDTEGAEKEVYLRQPRVINETHVIEDSREGWVFAFKRVLDAYSGKDSLPNNFDYSNIRPAGELIKGFGGIAPGPVPLKELLEKTNKILNKYVISQNPVDSTLIVDLMTFAGAAVVAGGVRRTAEIAFGYPYDMEFLDLKSQENLDNPELARWASNNSVIVKKGSSYTNIAERASYNGEPGLFWRENARAWGRMKDPKDHKDYRVMGTNPCGEITLEHGELCNICETFPSNHDSLEDYLKTLKYAFMYCKTVTLLPTHCDLTNQVQMRNRRIGVSQSGIVENIKRTGFREHIRWSDEGYKELEKWDKIYSEWLCVPRSIKLSTVKPSGTVSLLPQVTPGIHFPHSEYYIRRIRVSKNSDIWKDMEEAGYTVEEDVMLPDSTMVINFPVHEPNFDRRKDDVSIWEQLELAAQLQAYWADNSVSITVTVKPEEFKDISKALEMYESRLKTVSFLPLKDHKYKQAPYEEITKEEYEKLTKDLKKPKLHVDTEKEYQNTYCDGDVCEIEFMKERV